MINPIFTVSRTVVLTWIRGMASTFRTRPKNILYGGILLLLSAVALGFLLALIAVSGLNVKIPIELRSTILRTSIGGSVIIAGTIATILCITTPASNALNTLLDLLPISRVHAHIGMRMPFLIVGLSFSIPLSATACLIIVRLSSGWTDFLLSLTILVATILVALTTATGLFTIIHFFLRQYLRIPYNYATIMAGAIVIASSISTAIGDIVTLHPSTESGFKFADLLLHRVSASIVANPLTVGGWLGLAAWGLVGLLTFISSGHLHDQNLTKTPVLIFHGLTPSLSPVRGSLWFTFLLTARSSQFFMAALLPIPLLTTMWLFREHPFLLETQEAFALIIPSLPSYLAVYAVGRIIHSRWIGTMTTASSDWWIWPTIIVYTTISLTIATLVATAEITLGFIAINNLHELYSRVVLTVACALLGGALVPYNEEHPLTITAAGLATLVITMAASLLLSLATPTGHAIVGSSLRLLNAFFLILLVFMVCQRVEDAVSHAE